MPPTRRRPPPPGSRPPAGRRPRPRPPIRWSTRVAGGLALLVITVSGVGHAVVTGVNGAIGRVDAFGGMQGRPDGTKGTNFLLVGTDGRDGLDPSDRQRYHLGGTACHCTDTIMLIHLSADRRRAAVVSIPRDTYVRLPGKPPPAPPASAVPDAGSAGARSAPPPAAARPAKINQAFAEGGAKLTVRTVEQLTGIHVDHYLEVDFTSFMRTVDVIGGVPVCTAVPLRDPYTGLDLPVGTTTLDGGRALQYVRSRHIDGSADLGRMQRQQRFLAQVIRKITDGNTLGDPVAVGRIAGTALGSVRADQRLGAGDLIALAKGMKGLSAGSSEFVSVPLSDPDHEVPGVGSTVKWDDAKAGRLWAAIRADRPLVPHRQDPAHRGGTKVAVDPAQIRVTVANGTATSGLAAGAQRALRATGFVTPGLPTTAAHGAARTVIRYDPRWDRSVKSLAAALPGAALVPVAGQGPVMAVTLGANFARVAPVSVASGGVGEDAVTGDEVVCP
ncbi:LCP family protein [Actinacidiphila sp. ITFR-21]|uniref:LCP family protein n=1 Tax=Actinacidiphila sp. ITFR-21 TaxID=3075199 RepID=UPI00288A31CF|nr:LCP family protein [Streptomyces sp. ITFR-21]WNI15792.1 LCP family protein [Streptomyces sp. ITFR-21]